MPKLNFFEKFGLFTVSGFLSPKECEKIQSEMLASELGQAVILDADHKQTVQNTQSRSTGIAKIQQPTHHELNQRLEALLPEISKHFNLSLNKLQPLEFLVYGENDFFKKHSDTSEKPDAPEGIRARKITMDVFINGQAAAPTQSHYCGGALSLYGLMSKPGMDQLGIQFEPEPGDFMAFPANTPHEVQPITWGTRCTVITWAI